MSGSLDPIIPLFYAGEYGRIVEFARNMQLGGVAERERTSMVAAALFEVGDLTRARDWATLCANSTHPAARARGQLVMALCMRAGGDVERALQLHQTSLRSAEESNDDELQAWTAIHFLRHLFVSGRSVADAIVPNIRVKAAKAGATHVTAYLHATVAVGEGQAGRAGEARRHLQIAARLLHSKPHAWLECSILSTRAAIALAQRELPEVADCLERLRATATRHGLVADYARSNVNLGNWALFTGQFDAAELALQEAICSPHLSLIAKLTASETLAELRLAQGRLDDCEAILGDVQRTAKDRSLLSVFGVRWGSLILAQVLLRRGDASAALRQLTHIDSMLLEVSDRALTAATKVTAAQALVMCGDSAGGAQQLATSAILDPYALPHVQGHYYHAAAAAVAPSNQTLANALLLRAKDLRRSQGADSHDDLTTEENTPLGSSEPDSSGNGMGPLLVDSISSLLGLGANPRLLIDEMRRTIRRLGCSPNVVIRRGLDHAADSSREVQLLVPQKDGITLRLVCAVPASPDQAITLGSIIRVGESAMELERLRDAERQKAALWPATSVEGSAGAIFESEAMREILTIARRVADTSVPVLITGETGTGKEVLARLIHAYSGRAKAVFTPFNCSSMSRDVIESQLFGHRRGSFTGATDHSSGVVRAANRGTLLMDEIGDMPLEIQPKLLRFLESGEIHPLGEPQPIKVDVRVIAATNVDLKSLVSSGGFREDLYYRLSIVPLHLPPLRERRGEIASLAGHYLTKYGTEFRKGDLRLSEDAMEYLLLFRWPGNVRQLANEMRRIAALAEVGAVVMPEHLHAEITDASPAGRMDAPRREPHGNEIIVRIDQPVAAAVERIERVMIANALRLADGNVERAAAMLGLSRKGLYLKRQKYQITVGSDILQTHAATGD